MPERVPSQNAEGGQRVLVVMPTYNEALNIDSAVARVLAAVPTAHVLIVDDASPDGTGDLADAIAANDERVFVMHRAEKDGLGHAYLAGFAWAFERGYDVVVEMDADGSHPAERLPVMLEALAADPAVALVIGSRWVEGGSVVDWPRSREALSRSANLYARLALGIPIRDATAGYRAYTASVLRSVIDDSVHSRGYIFQIDLALRVHDSGHRIVEVPIEFHDRVAGTSKMSGAIVYEAMSKVTVWGIARAFGKKR